MPARTCGARELQCAFGEPDKVNELARTISERGLRRYRVCSKPCSIWGGAEAEVGGVRAQPKQMGKRVQCWTEPNEELDETSENQRLL